MLDTGGLDRINTLPKLLDYLRENCEWPIEEENFEDLVFDWDPRELGLKDAEDYRDIEIKQLRPLTSNQPWGIFFVNFPKKDLKVTILRRILGALTVKRRKSANKGEQAAWLKHDLLFLSAYGESGQRRLTFAHFQDDPEDPRGVARLDVLGWSQGNTIRRLSEVRHRLTDNLRWPAKGESIDAWRARWSSAFDERPKESITTSKQLASALAALAIEIRDRAISLLDEETDSGPLTKLYKAFKEALIHDLSPHRFADMYAQTITYGLLATTFRRTSGAVTADSISMMALPTNPFLADTLKDFLQAGGRKGGMDFDELGVNDVVEMLRRANMEAVLRDFDDRNPEQDPVIRFYEDFLKEYDPEERIKRGVFYTPRPIVSFIIRSVDEVLRRDFKLEDGLADTATWGEMEKRLPGLKRPKGVEADEPFVRVLDPATGTGTFVVEVIDLIHNRMVEKWKAAGKSDHEIEKLWNEYVPRHLLPRLYAFELMMAPYAIAHMKVGLKLFDTGYKFCSPQRAQIYLTNSLEEPVNLDSQLAFMSDALANEALAVNEVKRNKTFTAIVGNPPYSIASWNNGTWITNAIEVYKKTVRQEESQIQALSNDYIKFLRYSEWQIQKTGHGVVGLITGHGYLHGTQPRDLRKHLASIFEEIFCFDLHGSIRRAGPETAKDEPVFQIMTGVAIAVAVRSTKSGDVGGTKSVSITGLLANKFQTLENGTALSLTNKTPFHHPVEPYFHFSGSGIATRDDEMYQSWPDLAQIFGTGNRKVDKEIYWATGSASRQDDLAISFSHEEVAKKMEALATSKSFSELQASFDLCTTKHWNWEKAKKFARSGDWKKEISRIAFRPFDYRWTVLNSHIVTELREKVLSQFSLVEHNIGLISSRAVNDTNFAHSFVTTEPADKIFISSKSSTNAYIFPLFVNHNDLVGGSKPNFSPTFLAKLAKALAVSQTKETRLPEGTDAHDILGYIYAVLFCPSYRSRFNGPLKTDFPRIPLPGSAAVFQQLAPLGTALVALHLFNEVGGKRLAVPKDVRFAGHGAANVEKGYPTWSNGRVAINAERWFEEVPENVWTFYIGGYPVCAKWLKDRRIDELGRALNESEILHYRRIVTAISETIDLMAEIDRVIDRHGGWPGAFKGMSDKAE